MYDSRTRHRFLARQEIVAHVLATNVHETSLQLRLCTRDPPRIVCVQRRGADAWHDKVLRAARCTRCSHQSSDLAALLQQFAFHLLMIFHIFSQFFRSRRTLPRTTCTWFVHTRCNIVTYLEYDNLLTSFHYVCLRKCTVRTQSIVRRIYWKTVLVQDCNHETSSIYCQ